MSAKNTFVAEALKNEKFTVTENGAKAYKDTGDALVNMFATAGALRTQKNRDLSEDAKTRLRIMIDNAYKEDKYLLAKEIFYLRDIRGGLGERDAFQVAINYCANAYPEVIEPNIALIGKYGRWDDIYALIDTPLEEKMWADVKVIYEKDLALVKSGQHPETLLAKWLATADASSKNTRTLGIYTAKHLGKKVYDYKREVRSMRKAINIVEAHMSANDWTSYDYSKVPSRAMFCHRAAFARHDNERFQEFLNKAKKGEVKINAGTLYPYDLVEQYLMSSWNMMYLKDVDNAIEAQWKQLPNYIDGKNSAIVVADTSGSMSGRPIASAVGLAIYFAERNTGPFKDVFMTFSSKPTFHSIKGNLLHDKLASLDMTGWEMNTDLEAALRLVLDTAKSNKVKAEDVPKSLIVISDMEVDCCGSNKTFYKAMKKMYKKEGYTIPNIVFWNVNSRNDTFLADKDREGVQLVSGQAASTFRNLIGAIGSTPYELMLRVLTSERYNDVTVG